MEIFVLFIFVAVPSRECYIRSPLFTPIIEGERSGYIISNEINLYPTNEKDAILVARHDGTSGHSKNRSRFDQER